jgi:outer membrane protein assembly complex protein YaeT
MRRLLLCAALLAPLCACNANKPLVDEKDFPDITIEGNASLGRGELFTAALDHLKDYEDRGLGKAAIDDAAYRIELYYREHGFDNAEVRYELVEEQRPLVRFTVTEGPRIILEKLELVGGDELDRGRLRALAQDSTGPPGSPFVRRSLDQAAEAITAEARALGYASTKVAVEVEGPDLAAGTASARLVIDTGPRLILSAVEVLGEGVPEDIAHEVHAEIGEPFGARLVVTVLARIEERLRDAGFADAEAEVGETRIEEGQVVLVVQVKAGDRVRITGVRFEGNETTSPKYLEDLVRMKPGERYSADDVRAAFQRLYSTGLFEVVRHRLEPATGEERELVWELKEIPSLELWMEPGYGSYDEVRVRAGLREHNLLGRGWILRSEGTLSDKTKRAEIGVTDPLFFGTDLLLDTAVEYNYREEPSFTFEEGVLETSLRKRWNQRFSTALAYRFKRSNLLSEDLDLTDPEDVPSDFDISAIKLSGVNDTRDNLLVPKTGTRTELSGEWADAALGSELDFLRGVGSFSIFKQLRQGTVLAARTAGGMIVPLNATLEIPIQERFFLGGETTVRSFDESQLGPKDSNGEPLGGEAYTLFSLELRQSLPKNLGVALFADTGSVVSDYADVFSDGDYRSALGVGLRYELPVGSLRLDFGWNPDPRDDEEDYAIHFSIGQAF